MERSKCGTIAVGSTEIQNTHNQGYIFFLHSKIDLVNIDIK